MLRSQILGVGSYVPDNVVTNFDLAKFIDTSDEWITQRTGIKERRWVKRPGTESNSDLAIKATEKALKAANVPKEKLDLIVYATVSPDHEFPGTGCYFQAKLGIKDIPTLDIRQQCSGFIYGLSIADQYIRTGMYKTILVIGSEIHSIGLDKTIRGRDLTVLFGDGAGAAVLGAVDIKDVAKDRYIYSTHLHTDGSFADELCLPAPGNAFNNSERIDAAMLSEGLHYPRMNGRRVFTSAVIKMGEVIMEGLKANKLSPSDIDLFLFHQANLRISEAVGEQLEIPGEKIFNTIHKYGNTTAATIPLGMNDALLEGKLKPGMLITLAAFGGGFTWGSCVLRY